MKYRNLLGIYIINMCYYCSKSTENGGKKIESPIFFKQNNFFYTRQLAIIGHINYIIQNNISVDKIHSSHPLTLEINYKDIIYTTINLDEFMFNPQVLGKLLEQFFFTIAHYKKVDYLTIILNPNNIFHLKVHKNNVILLEKKYIIVPIKVMDKDGLLENKEILYDPNGYIAYSISSNPLSNLYINMAQNILDELATQVINIVK